MATTAQATVTCPSCSSELTIPIVIEGYQQAEASTIVTVQPVEDLDKVIARHVEQLQLQV